MPSKPTSVGHEALAVAARQQRRDHGAFSAVLWRRVCAEYHGSEEACSNAGSVVWGDADDALSALALLDHCGSSGATCDLCGLGAEALCSPLISLPGGAQKTLTEEDVEAAAAQAAEDSVAAWPARAGPKTHQCCALWLVGQVAEAASQASANAAATDIVPAVLCGRGRTLSVGADAKVRSHSGIQECLPHTRSPKLGTLKSRKRPRSSAPSFVCDQLFDQCTPR